MVENAFTLRQPPVSSIIVDCDKTQEPCFSTLLYHAINPLRLAPVCVVEAGPVCFLSSKTRFLRSDC